MSLKGTQPLLLFQGYELVVGKRTQDEHLALTNQLLADIGILLRILFAINQQWEPDWKWFQLEVERLTIKLKGSLSEAMLFLLCNSTNKQLPAS